MGEDDPRGFDEERDSFDKVVSDRYVLLNDPSFLVGKRAGLQKNCVRNRELPDVMQPCPHRQALELHRSPIH